MYVFLCTTPLQVRIAQYLRAKHSDTKLIYITESERFDTLSDIAKKKQEFYALQCDGWVKLSSIEDITKLNFNEVDLSGIYYASFDNPFIITFVRKYSNVACFSFDDGLADVYTKGIYTNAVANYLKHKSLTHYTFYDSINHVILKDNLVKIDVVDVFGFSKSRRGLQSLKKKLTILLGEEICVDPQLALNFNQPYLDTLGVDVYLPHPNSRFKIKSDKLEVTPLILEDYLLQKFEEYKEIEIYHFSSSAAIHLQDIDGLTFKGIKLKPLSSLQKEMELMGASFEIIPIDYKL